MTNLFQTLGNLFNPDSDQYKIAKDRKEDKPEPIKTAQIAAISRTD